MTETAIRIDGFTKEYAATRRADKRTAVDNLTLDVPAGALFGFLGPNGAGKTTTIKMLLGFLPPTRGAAWIFDLPVADTAARARVGYLPEQPYFPKFLTAQEVVAVHAGLSGRHGKAARECADKAMRRVGMYDYRNMPLAKCSKGMVQRVGLATALVGDPRLLILDEPSSGLDPVGRKELRELLTELQAEGVTVFLSSHLLSEMESLCDHVGILCRGKLAACGTPAQIVQSRDEVLVRIEQSERDGVLAAQVQSLGGTLDAAPDSGRATVMVPSNVVYQVMSLLDSCHARLVSVTQSRESLEDAFLRLVG
jgi:ABC-2 type transport system ATP-binding protein